MKKTVSGIRGIFGREIGLADVLEFCSNFSVLAGSGRCVIGMDTRPSGDMMRNAAAAALLKNGVDVFDLGMAPTPVVFYEARRYGAGVMVTSSHNPMEWNGLKLIIGGRGISEDELSQVTSHQDVRFDGVGKMHEIGSGYVDAALEVAGMSDANPGVVVDVGGGAARGYAQRLLEGAGCTVSVMNEDPYHSTRGPDPTADGLSDLTAAARDGRIGFAFDLDGDRLVVVNDGRRLAPDVTLGLGVARSLKIGCRKFVLSADSSVSIERYILERGGTVHRSKVGEANVVARMLETGSEAGGEGSSGGFILPGFSYCRDGILTSAMISSMLGTPEFREVVELVGGMVQIREKIPAESGLHDAIMGMMAEVFEGEFSQVDMLDGIKGVADERSWILIRKSNTEDVIRVSAESDSRAKCMRMMNDARRHVMECHERARRA